MLKDTFVSNVDTRLFNTYKRNVKHFVVHVHFSHVYFNVTDQLCKSI